MLSDVGGTNIVPGVLGQLVGPSSLSSSEVSLLEHAIQPMIFTFKNES